MDRYSLSVEKGKLPWMCTTATHEETWYNFWPQRQPARHFHRDARKHSVSTALQADANESAGFYFPAFGTKERQAAMQLIEKHDASHVKSSWRSKQKTLALLTVDTLKLVSAGRPSMTVYRLLWARLARSWLLSFPSMPCNYRVGDDRAGRPTSIDGILCVDRFASPLSGGIAVVRKVSFRSKVRQIDIHQFQIGLQNRWDRSPNQCPDSPIATLMAVSVYFCFSFRLSVSLYMSL